MTELNSETVEKNEVASIKLGRPEARFDIFMIGLILIIAGGIAAIFVTGRMVMDANNEISLIQSDIQGQYLLRDRFNELTSKYLDISDDNIISYLQTALPNADNFLQVVEELEELADESGNNIIMQLGEAKLTSEGLEVPTSTTIQENVQSGEGYDYIDIEVTLRGNYAQMEEFINMVSQSKYYMDIQDLVMNKQTRDRVLDSHLGLRIFVEKVLYQTKR